jgi:hypothetical protein
MPVPRSCVLGENDMTQQTIDAAFLRGYVVFSSFGPLRVAECLYTALVEAHRKKDFATVGHLQIHLHAEMVACLEKAGALLRAYSRWEQPGGVLISLLAYRPGQVPQFMQQLTESDDVLRLLCFPNKDDLLAHADVKSHLKRGIEEEYSGTELKRVVTDTCKIYLSENVRDAYNKVKHGYLRIRHPDMLRPVSGKVARGDDVCILTYRRQTGSIDFGRFKVTGPKALRLAGTYVDNIKFATKQSRALAGFAAFCLKRGLMLHSGQS